MSIQTAYDVLILGGGWAGNCQARHLVLNIPGIRVGLVEPRSDAQVIEDRKLGESTVEIAALHLCKELGLHDYLIENHPPKYGLNFHWARDVATTATLDDYYSIWTNRSPTIAAFQIHRGKLERDLLRMNADAGVDVLRERVTDFELTAGDALHRVVLKSDAGGGTREVLARHLVDAAGRKFLIGKRTDNILRGPEHHYGHLDPGFIRRLSRWSPLSFTAGVYDDLNAIVDSGANLGFMDPHRADQLGRGYSTWRVGKPKNLKVGEMRRSFRDYRYTGALAPWAAAKRVIESPDVAPRVYSSLAGYQAEAAPPADEAAASP
jgi:hypothetical protein